MRFSETGEHAARPDLERDRRPNAAQRRHRLLPAHRRRHLRARGAPRRRRAVAHRPRLDAGHDRDAADRARRCRRGTRASPSAAGAISAQWNGALTAQRAGRGRRAPWRGATSRSTAARVPGDHDLPARRSGSRARRTSPSAAAAHSAAHGVDVEADHRRHRSRRPTGTAACISRPRSRTPRTRIAERQRAGHDQRATTRRGCGPPATTRREPAPSPRARGTRRRSP